MKRARIASAVAAVLTGALLAGSALSSNRGEDARYQLRIELTGIPHNSNPTQILDVKPHAPLDVPIRYELKQPSGAIVSFEDQKALVPSAELPKGDEIHRAELIPVGPRLQVRIEPFESGAAILQATLSDTRLPKHSIDERTLHAVVTTGRFVEPVKLDAPITLTWPATEMKVTLTVESRK